MATILESLPSGSTFTITLATLASAGAQQSVSVDNTTNLYDDYLVVLKAKNHASSAPTGQKCLNLYVGGTVDGGTTWTENPTVSASATTDTTITLSSPSHARFLGQLFFSAAAQTKIAGPFSVAQAFGGVIPAKWYLIVENQTGFTLDTTEGNFAKQYQGVAYTVA